MNRWEKAILATFASTISIACALLPNAAFAATAAVAMTTINMRAGPDIHYPIVSVLPTRARLTVFGCNAKTTWCDVSWGRNRGWVSANYIQLKYHGVDKVLTPVTAPVVGLTVVTFNRAYWDRYYVDHPWYGQYDVYYHKTPHPAGSFSGDNAHCFDGRCVMTTVRRGPYGRVQILHSYARW